MCWSVSSFRTSSKAAARKPSYSEFSTCPCTTATRCGSRSNSSISPVVIATPGKACDVRRVPLREAVPIVASRPAVRTPLRGLEEHAGVPADLAETDPAVRRAGRDVEVVDVEAHDRRDGGAGVLDDGRRPDGADAAAAVGRRHPDPLDLAGGAGH